MRTRFTIQLVTAFGLSVALAAGGQGTSDHTFDELPVGSSPPNFTFGSMRQAEPGRWTVQKRDDNAVLCHERDNSRGYSLAIANGVAPSDLALTVRLRLAEGARTGGLVWRYLDDDHYYSLVLDLNRGSIALYRVHGGNRIELESEDDLELDALAWHDLKVVHVGDTIRASIGGVGVFTDTHRRNAWPRDPSRVGVIATGHSGVDFDDLHVAPRGERR